MPWSVVRGIADAEGVVPDEADYIARIRLIHRFAFVAEKPVRAGQAHLLCRARMMHRHVTLEFARTNTDERHTVAMPRVRIRLYFEDETRKLRVLRRNLHAGQARPGWRRMFQEPVEQKLHAEVVDGAAEEDRCGCVREHRGVIPLVPGVFEHVEFFHCPVEGCLVETGAD